VVFVHAAPAALCPHVEWALGGVLGMRVSLEWTAQPAAPGTYRAELSWQARAGTAAAVSSALRRWRMLRFEVTEEPSRAGEGERYSFTPDLGLWRASTGVHGDVLVGEDRLRAAMERAAAGGTTLEDEVRALLGAAWDEELEPFRHAGEGAPVRWLHQVV
jgi:hypothetical protein